MEQSNIDDFRHQNRYEGRHGSSPSDEVYKKPLRTRSNGWLKWHSSCGRDTLHYIENTDLNPVDERYEWEIYCFECGHDIPENEVLFIDSEWYYEYGYDIYEQTFDSLFIPPERVIELGSDPESHEVLRALKMSKVEQNANVDLIQVGTPLWDGPYECNECDKEIPARLDGMCLECYDGETTEIMKQSVNYSYRND